MMQAHVEIRLYASLKPKTPENADRFPISPGMTVGEIIRTLGVPDAEAKLIFINGVKGTPDATLNGGERIAIFPPVGGG